MQIIQSRRDFLASAVVGRSRRRAWRPNIARRRGAAGDDDDPAAEAIQRLRCAPVRRRGAAARGRLHRRPLRPRRGGQYATPAWLRRWQAGFLADRLRPFASVAAFASMPASRSRCWPACIPAAIELFAHEPIQTITRPEGQERCRPGSDRLRRAPAILAIMTLNVGLDPAKDIAWVTRPGCHAHRALHRREESMPSSAFRPSRGAARPQASAA